MTPSGELTTSNEVEDMVRRLRLHSSWRDSHGELNDAPNDAITLLQSLSRQLEEARELERAAEEYCQSYLLDELNDPEFCGIDERQHRAVVRLFGAIRSLKTEQVKNG